MYFPIDPCLWIFAADWVSKCKRHERYVDKEESLKRTKVKSSYNTRMHGQGKLLSQESTQSGIGVRSRFPTGRFSSELEKRKLKK